MGLYSQEFEMQIKADRAHSTLFGMKEIEAREYKNGKLTGITRAGEGVLKNNGQFILSQRLSYAILNSDGSRRAVISAPRATGETLTTSAGRGLLESKSRVAKVFFPQEVTALSGADRIRGRAVKYNPELRLVESESPVDWIGANRDFHGVGFTYNLDSADLRVGGPIQGNFIPDKNDFSTFAKKR